MKPTIILVFLLAAILQTTHVSSQTSCSGRCGESGTSSTCWCNNQCEDFSDCCSDYDSICLSCQDRCGEYYSSGKPCQCNSACENNYDCCDDYSSECGGGGGGATDADVIALTEELYNLDLSLLVGDQITIDKTPPGPLFTNVDSSALTGPTITTFLPLRDNYVPDASVPEEDDSQELLEKNAFLDAIMATDVMIRTEEFLQQYNLISKSLRDVIDEIWFTRYVRAANSEGSSGFEHSFMGEIDDGIVKGFHNWISFYEEEKAGNIDYKSFIDEEVVSSELDLFMLSFNWDGYVKSTDSIWIGSTPELELAVYTVCFYHKPNALCDVSMNGVSYKIQTYQQSYNGGTYVGSAYPDIS